MFLRGPGAEPLASFALQKLGESVERVTARKALQSSIAANGPIQAVLEHVVRDHRRSLPSTSEFT